MTRDHNAAEPSAEAAGAKTSHAGSVVVI